MSASTNCPSYVKTSLVEGQNTDQAKVHGMSEKQVIRDVILASQPNKRFVELDQLAAFVVFSLLGGGILDHRHSVANRRRLDSSLSGAGRLWWQSHYHSEA